MRRQLLMIACAAVFVVAATFPAQAQQNFKIGVFDPQRVAEESAQGKQLQARLTAIQQTKQNDLVSREQDLGALQKQYTEQSLSLSPERRQGLQIDIERRKLELDNARNLATQELQLEFAGAQNSFNEMLVNSVQAFGRSEGFDLILDIGAVAWAGPTLDVTTAVIDQLDQMFPAGAQGASPGAQGDSPGAP